MGWKNVLCLAKSINFFKNFKIIVKMPYFFHEMALGKIKDLGSELEDNIILFTTKALS